jgi:hypothetical protein
MVDRYKKYTPFKKKSNKLSESDLVKKVINEKKSESKEDWWDKNYKRLLKSIKDLPYEDWEGLVKHPEDFEGVYDSTNKQRGLYLLHTYSIDELEEFIDSNTFDED